MSWETITYYTVRCDGDVRNGQCDAILRNPSDPPPVVNDIDGEHVTTPALFTRPNLPLSESGVDSCGWMLTPDNRVLCPEHVRALEIHAEAELDGLPF